MRPKFWQREVLPFQNKGSVMPQDAVAQIRELLQSFDTALLVTEGGHGQPCRARPMAVAHVEPDCSLWFFTGRDSGKVHEIQEDSHVLIACQNDHSRYLSLSGTATLIFDHAKASELWSESYRSWFPRGVDDPDLLLIYVRPVQAEFWDNQGMNAVRYAFETVRAYVTGDRPQVEEGEQHGRVAFG
jgi:general stress protein 26